MFSFRSISLIVIVIHPVLSVIFKHGSDAFLLPNSLRTPPLGVLHPIKAALPYHRPGRPGFCHPLSVPYRVLLLSLPCPGILFQSLGANSSFIRSGFSNYSSEASSSSLPSCHSLSLNRFLLNKDRSSIVPYLLVLLMYEISFLYIVYSLRAGILPFCSLIRILCVTYPVVCDRCSVRIS